MQESPDMLGSSSNIDNDLAARRHANTLVPIACLPPETLFHIFKPCRDTSDEHVALWQEKWVAVTHVCHYWRAVTLSTPSLWAEVIFRCSSPPEEMQEWLTRSGQAPLNVILRPDLSSVDSSRSPVPQ